MEPINLHEHELYAQCDLVLATQDGMVVTRDTKIVYYRPLLEY